MSKENTQEGMEETKEEMLKALDMLVETNWQFMNGDELLDVVPKRWMNERLQEYAALAVRAREEELREKIARRVLPRALPREYFETGYNEAIEDVLALLKPKQEI